MNKISKTIFASLLLITPFVMSSCEKDEDEDITILSPIAGDYKGQEACDGGDPGSDYLVHIYNTADDASKVFVDNPFDIGERFVAKVNGNSFTVDPTQIEVPDFYGEDTSYISTFSATGTVNGSKLELKFKLERVTGEANPDSTYVNFYAGDCVFNGDRDYLEPPVGNGL